jgi:glycolate oxidase
MTMMDSALIDRLAAIVGPDNVLREPEELLCYGFDATQQRALPDCVVFPRSTEQVSEVMRFAFENEIPVYTRGAGSGLSGGSVPLAGGIALTMTRMNHILEINTDDLYARVEPGVVVADLIREAAKHGLLYPPDPSSMKTCTMGGAVAENAGGLRGLKYGVTRDYIISLIVVGADGSVFKTGAITVKHVSGYDLTKLFVGSEGTLGVITEITAKLIPAPEARRSLMAVFDDIRDAGRTVAAVIKSGTIPATLEIMDRITINAVEDAKGIGLPRDADALLLFETDGAPETVAKEADRIVEICRAHRATEIRVAATDDERDAIWAARRAALPSLARVKPTCILEDATVPRSRVPQMLEAVMQIAERHRLIIGTFGHAGDGNLHPTIICDERDAEEMERVEKAVEEIFHAAIRLGGTLSGEHGIGLAKRRFLELEFGAAGVAAMRAVKAALDPKNILNPGKIFEVKPCLTS